MKSKSFEKVGVSLGSLRSRYDRDGRIFNRIVKVMGRYAPGMTAKLVRIPVYSRIFEKFGVATLQV